MSIETIPSDPSSLTLGEEQIANKIKHLYNTIDRDCYLYVQPRLRNLEPDFILIDPLKGACIIEVKDWSRDYINSINRIKVSTNDGKTLYNPVFRANQYFNLAKGLFESDTRLLDEEGYLNFNIYSKVIFTNIDSSKIDDLNVVLNQPPTKYFTSNQMRKLDINTLFSIETCNLKPVQILVIRSVLFPEIKLHDDIGKDSDFEFVDMDETIKALDIKQEKLAKRIPHGHYMVSGVPGSGKTVILLSRAIFLLKENPDWKVRIVTYNRSLSRNMESRLESLYPDLDLMGINYENITISTFSKLALEVANIIASPQDADNDWWTYELPQKALEKARPKFDAVLIDEYQDFYDEWIKLCLALCKKHKYNNREESENFFLAGDRLQSIYNPNNHTWKSLGIKVHGGMRSTLLKHTYRSGKSQIELALDFLMGDSKLKKEVETFYEGREGIDSKTDLDDQIVFLEGGYEVINNVLEQLIYKEGYKPWEILILARTHKETNDLYDALNKTLKDKCKATKDVCENKCTITTYHSSKGLESKICILVNVCNLPNKLSTKFSKEIEEKKLLYVGMTRASHRLYIHATNYENASFAKQLRFREFEDTSKQSEIDEYLSF